MIYIGLAILFASLIAACSGNQAAPTSSDPGSPADDGGSPDPLAIDSAWQASPHASTFVLDDRGENNACARCHSPINWVATMDDMPESCLACKFEIEDPIPLIPEADWLSIPCIVCHERDGNTVEPEIAWLEIAQLESYAQVESANELCLKCHGDESIVGHTFPQLGGAHAEYQCVECHDAHDVTATCADEVCHADVLDPAAAIAGHDDDHLDVACWACHDGEGFAVQPDVELGFWTTMFAGGSPEESIAIVSHNIIREANCDRCHFVDNPWDLSAEVIQP